MNILNINFIEKILAVEELAEKVDLNLEQFETRYLTNMTLITENIELVEFVVKMSYTLADVRNVCRYIFDFAFHIKTFGEFKSLFRSTIFPMLKSIELLADRLLTEIREDTFSIKFNYNLIEDNKTNIMKSLGEMTKDLELVPNREAIENTTNS